MGLVQIAQAAAPYAIQALPYVANYAIDALQDYLEEGDDMYNPALQAAGLPPVYNTNQADEALRGNNTLVAQGTAQQLSLEEQMRQQRAANDLQRQIGYENVTADRANAAVNANTARNMAVAAQQALNNQYIAAGNRLNQAAQATQGALNTAAANVGGMFR